MNKKLFNNLATKSDVEAKMTYTDAYGHDVKVSVDVTVKKR